VQPDDRRARFGFKCVGDATGKLGPESQSSSGQATKFQEASTRDTVSSHYLVESLVGGHYNSPIWRCALGLVVCRAFFLFHFRVAAFLHIQDMTTQLAQYCCRMRYFGIVVDTSN